jgi:hypothetical protein
MSPLPPPPIDNLKWKIYNPIIYLEVRKVYSFWEHVCIYLFRGGNPRDDIAAIVDGVSDCC